LVIESESLIDLAGNFGPTGTQMIFFEAVISEPAPDVIQENNTDQGVEPEKESESDPDSDSESDSESQTVLPLIPPAIDQPVESGSNDPVAPNQSEVALVAAEELVAISAPRDSGLPEKLSDGEVIQPPLRQAAARLILPETSFESTSNSWIIWLTTAIALAITGYLVSRRGRLPEMLTS
jgi:DNA-binding transcriptional MocR family regulator